jgi:hypothetical protein
MTEDVGMAISAELATAESIEQLASMLIDGAYMYAKEMGQIADDGPIEQFLMGLKN